MKICLFADAQSIHTVRWCNYFVDLGHDVHLISFKYSEIESITNHLIDVGDISVRGGNWKVLLHFRKVKSVLNKLKPDVFHALYATSYGITGALCNFHPFVITALGSDVLISPFHSKIIKFLLKWSFKRADWITSMADHMTLKINTLVEQYEKVTTLPFGIDTSLFYEKHTRDDISNQFILISTRNFEQVYNIHHLIYAYYKIIYSMPNSKLILIGDGTQRVELENLVKELGLSNHIEFKGKVKQIEIADALNQAHVFISVSKSDGNNISLNEAMACGTFCIATSIPANTQWIEDSKNGFLVEIDEVEELATKLLISYNDYYDLQDRAQIINREIISQKADWNKNMSSVIINYERLIKSKRS